MIRLLLKGGLSETVKGGGGGGGGAIYQQRYEDDNQYQEPANAQLTLC